MPDLAAEIRKKWKPRQPRSHKGDYGRILILAGSEGMTGAAHLAGMGALRSGAGLVTLGVPRGIYPLIARREAEIMVRSFPATPEGSLSYRALKPVRDFISNRQDVLALGPGLSLHAGTQRLVQTLVAGAQVPLVIDADAITALKGHVQLIARIRSGVVMTPHPGEFIRVFGGTLGDFDRERKARALKAAKQCGAVIVLKGHRTVVASPSGAAAFNTTGNPGMATGGSGDVLTGILAALIGQGLAVYDAARFGTYVHGLAGDLAARKVGQISLTAGDILEFLPAAFKRIFK